MTPRAGRDAARDKKGNFALELGARPSTLPYLTLPYLTLPYLTLPYPPPFPGANASSLSQLIDKRCVCVRQDGHVGSACASCLRTQPCAHRHRLPDTCTDPSSPRFVPLPSPSPNPPKPPAVPVQGMLEGAADPAPVANGGGCDGSGATGTAEEEAAAAPPQPAPHSELTTCELCRIANGHLTARKVYEDKLFVALADPQGDAAHHYVVLPRAHLPPVDKLLPRHLPVVQHLLVVANRVLRDAGADTLDVLLGFHQPPFVSGCHLYLTALSPRSGMRMWASNVRYSRMVFTPVHAAIAHLEAMA